MYGSSFWSVTRRPRALSRRPSEDAVSPFPRELVTPPVTKMCFVTGGQHTPATPRGMGSGEDLAPSMPKWTAADPHGSGGSRGNDMRARRPSTATSTRRSGTVAAAAVGVAGLLAASLMSASPAAAGADTDPAQASLPTVSSGERPGPAVLYAPEPDLPQLQNRHDWFDAPYLRVSGAERYMNGEYQYTDHLYDDYGADTDSSGGSSLTESAGDFSYPADRARYGDNAADLFELRIARRDDGMRVRFSLNTLLADDTTIAFLAFDADDDDATGSATIPHNPGAPLPGHRPRPHRVGHRRRVELVERQQLGHDARGHDGRSRGQPDHRDGPGERRRAHGHLAGHHRGRPPRRIGRLAAPRSRLLGHLQPRVPLRRGIPRRQHRLRHRPGGGARRQRTDPVRASHRLRPPRVRCRRRPHPSHRHHGPLLPEPARPRRGSGPVVPRAHRPTGPLLAVRADHATPAPPCRSR